MKTYPFWFKCTIILLGLILFYVILVYGKFILMPLAMSALVAMLLEPLSRWLEKLKIGRISAILLSLFLVIIVTIGIFSLLSIQFVQFADRLPEANEKLQVISGNLQLLICFREQM